MHLQKLFYVAGLVAAPVLATSVPIDDLYEKSNLTDSTMMKSNLTSEYQAQVEALMNGNSTAEIPVDAEELTQEQIKVINYMASHKGETRKLLDKYLDELVAMKPEEIKENLLMADVPEEEAELIASNPSLLKEKKSEIVKASVDAIEVFSEQIEKEFPEEADKVNEEVPKLPVPPASRAQAINA